jgi:hypothetical protein
MGDIADTQYIAPYPHDIVSGVGETDTSETSEEVEEETVIETENSENGDENLGRHIDVTV